MKFCLFFVFCLINSRAKHSGIHKIRQSTIYYAGLLGRWDKQIAKQECDVSIFYTCYRLRALKALYFIFVLFKKKK